MIFLIHSYKALFQWDKHNEEVFLLLQIHTWIFVITWSSELIVSTRIFIVLCCGKMWWYWCFDKSMFYRKRSKFFEFCFMRCFSSIQYLTMYYIKNFNESLCQWLLMRRIKCKFESYLRYLVRGWFSTGRVKTSNTCTNRPDVFQCHVLLVNTHGKCVKK